jgi:hypothetical protein
MSKKKYKIQKKTKNTGIIQLKQIGSSLDKFDRELLNSPDFRKRLPDYDYDKAVSKIQDDLQDDSYSSNQALKINLMHSL